MRIYHDGFVHAIELTANPDLKRRIETLTRRNRELEKLMGSYVEENAKLEDKIAALKEGLVYAQPKRLPEIKKTIVVYRQEARYQRALRLLERVSSEPLSARLWDEVYHFLNGCNFHHLK